ncbi:MAG TPA: hypothetical protein VJJ98_07110 [Sedimentisphaerales bacterium]|nr:hypothetical protein [Sedimentisphaerales bacterium]
MGESATHIKLVEELSSWISVELLYGDSGPMLIDHPNSNKEERPPKIEGFIPDVCIPNGPGNIFIIGEAKTAQDLEKNHSIAQIRGFLRRCSQTPESIFVLAVPWHMTRLGKNMLRYLKDRIGADNVRTEVLERLID